MRPRLGRGMALWENKQDASELEFPEAGQVNLGPKESGEAHLCLWLKSLQKG